jgi:hypothetical protein
MDNTPPPVVAILNTNDDTVEMLRILFETNGMVAVSAHLDDIRRGHFDFSGFLREHDPKVVVVDIAPPYDRSWMFYKHLKGTIGKGRRFVVTSTNPARVQQVAHADEPVLEVVGKPYDLDLILAACRQALG